MKRLINLVAVAGFLVGLAALIGWFADWRFPPNLYQYDNPVISKHMLQYPNPPTPGK